MAKLFVYAALLATLGLGAQAPRLINYQGALRNPDGSAVADKTISIRFQVFQGSGATAAHTEDQSLVTDELGLFSTQIGKTTTGGITGVDFTAPDLSLLVSVDTTGGNNFIALGDRQQLVSVPYSMYAQSVPSSYSNNVLSVGDKSYTLSTSVGNVQGSGEGIAAVNNSGSNFTVNVPAPALTSSGNTISLQQGTVVTSATLSAVQPTLSASGNTLTLNMGTNPASVVLNPPTLTLTGADNNELSAGGNTVNLTTYTTGTGLSMSGPATSRTISAISGSFQSQGIASVTPQSGTMITVSVPGPTLSSTGSVLTLSQGTVVTTATITATPGLTLAGAGNNSLTAGTNTVVLNTYTAGSGLSLTGIAPNQTISASSTGTNAVWSTLGNVGTNTLTNFIGTTDNQRLIIRVNNQRSGIIDHQLQNVLLGYQTGTAVTTGSSNVVVGHQAFAANTAAGNNVVLGANALATQSFNNGGTSWTTDNIAIGSQALFSNQPTSFSNGRTNIAIGTQALFSNTIGNGNNAVGYQALYSNQAAIDNNAFGSRALYSNTTGNDNNAVGFNASYSNTIGGSNNAFGAYALYKNTSGNNNTAIGDEVLYNNTGSNNVAIGAQTSYSNTSGINNTAVGNQVLFQNSSGDNNTGMGFQALALNTSGSLNTAIGYWADVSAGNLSNATAIGANAKVRLSNSLVLGDTTNVNVGIGTGAPTKKLDVRGQIRIVDGTQAAGRVLTSDAQGNASWQAAAGGGWGLTGNAGTSTLTNFIGTTDNVAFNFRANNQKAGTLDPIRQNAYFGYQSGNATTTGSMNTAMGHQAMFINTIGERNVAVGNQALYNNTSGNFNQAIGYNALYNNQTGSGNIGIGYFSLFNSTGSDNTGVGREAVNLNTTGTFNTGFGRRALYNNTTGSNNSALGNEAGVISGTLSNVTAIGANAKVGLSNSMVLGDTSNVNVGIGTGYPSKKLHVKGQVRIVDGTEAAGRVLTSDAQGNASWQVASGGGWGLTGNAGTSTLTNFIGTTDSQPLIFKVGNQKSGLIDWSSSSGNTAFGYQATQSLTTGFNNTAIGYEALRSINSGNNNTAIGHGALDNNTGNGNTALGTDVLSNNTNGGFNVGIGFSPLSSNISGSHNIGIGANALENNNTGFSNIGIGMSALHENINGSLLTAIGNQASVITGSLTNATAIGNNAKVGLSNSMVLGDTSNVNVGIGTGYPSKKLHVKGQVRIVDGTEGSGKVLTSDAQGNASWQVVSTSSSNICFIKDVKSNGISGGTFTSLVWQTRDLNTIEGSSGLVALAANQFTLQPGTYIIRVEAPAYAVDNHKAKLRNISDATDAIIGRAAFASTLDKGESISIVEGVINITSAKAFQVQHYGSVTQNANGLGASTSMGLIEVYTQVQITKIN